MVCYYFPPVATSGTTRSVRFATRLPKFGWHPTVLTVARSRDAHVSSGEPVPQGIPIVRSHEWNLDGLVEIVHGALDRLVRLFGTEMPRNYLRELVCIPDPHIVWSSLRPARRLASSHDVIYATCSPFSSALSAVLAGRIAGTPVVLDFRDPWTLNPHNDRLWPHRVAIRILERFVLRHCSALIVNTNGALRLYRTAYPEFAHKLVVIPNGYDYIPTPVPRAQNERFRIVHVGSFYGRRSPTALLRALAQANDPTIEYVQVGPPWPGMEQFEDRVRITVTGHVTRERALELMQGASLLHLAQGFEPRVVDYVAVAAKTYEYLASGLPILADCPPGDNVDIVTQYARTSYIVTSQDVSELLQAVIQARRIALTEPAVSSEFIKDFAPDRLTEMLAAVLSSATSRYVSSRLDAHCLLRES